jgi:hypothetical protein
MSAPNSRNRNMAAIVTAQQKALQTWIKLRTKRAAAVAAKPAKHAKKSGN